jgi:hypothetical protein
MGKSDFINPARHQALRGGVTESAELGDSARGLVEACDFSMGSGERIGMRARDGELILIGDMPIWPRLFGYQDWWYIVGSDREGVSQDQSKYPLETTKMHTRCGE